MKILFITTRLPHARVLSGHAIVHQRIRRLAERGHRLGLAVFSSEDDAEHLAGMRELVGELEVVPRPSGRRGWPGRGSLAPEPFRAHASRELSQRVGDLVERSRYDVVLAEFGVMGQALFWNPYLPATRTVVSVHHSLSIVNEKALKMGGWNLATARAWLTSGRVRRYELQLYRAMDRVLVLTPEERYGLLKLAPDLRITAIPSGVDTTYFQPTDSDNREQAVLFTGHYSEAHNLDAVRWFVRWVWPLLRRKMPSIRFYVVGPGLPPELRDLSRKDSSIVVTGAVEDVRPYLARARVFVCPVRMGSGMRGKILEAMAAGVPVVSTSLGAEGFPIQIGDNAFLADTPVIMAQQIEWLLGDSRLQASIAQNAREMVCQRFSWNRGIELLENTLQEVVRRA